MNIMKRIFLLLFTVLCIIVLQACNAEPKDAVVTAQNGEQYVPNADPKPLEKIDETFSNMLGIYNETEYSEIVVKSVKDVYSLSSDSAFSCTISNNNAGYGFYMYEVLYIDKLIDGEWIRQCNKYAVDAAYHLQWVYIGIEGNTEGINSTTDGIAVNDIFPGVTPGRYRLVVFTPKNTHYAEFEVQE